MTLNYTDIGARNETDIGAFQTEQEESSSSSSSASSSSSSVSSSSSTSSSSSISSSSVSSSSSSESSSSSISSSDSSSSSNSPPTVVVRFVDTAAAAGGDGTTPLTEGAARAYSSLSEWQTAEATNLVSANQRHIVVCTGTDTTSVAITGWTTDSTHTVSITPSVRHSGTEGTGSYIFMPDGASTIGIDILSNNVIVDGIEIYDPNALSIQLIVPNTNADNITIKNCIIHGVKGQAPNLGLQYNTTGTVYAYNNIIYDIGSTIPASACIRANGTGDFYCYNNTAYNSFSQGLRIVNTDCTCYAKNNLITDCDDANYYNSGSWGAGSDYNASGDATSTGGEHDRTEQTFTFVDDNPSIGKDLHLAADDTGALGFGVYLGDDTYLPFSTDIDGEERGLVWDIGADQFVEEVSSSSSSVSSSSTSSSSSSESSSSVSSSSSSVSSSSVSSSSSSQSSSSTSSSSSSESSSSSSATPTSSSSSSISSSSSSESSSSVSSSSSSHSSSSVSSSSSSVSSSSTSSSSSSESSSSTSSSSSSVSSSSVSSSSSSVSSSSTSSSSSSQSSSSISSSSSSSSISSSSSSSGSSSSSSASSESSSSSSTVVGTYRRRIIITHHL